MEINFVFADEYKIFETQNIVFSYSYFLYFRYSKSGRQMNTNFKLALVLIILLMVGCGKKEPAKFQLAKGTVIIEGKVSNFRNYSDLISFVVNDIFNTVPNL